MTFYDRFQKILKSEYPQAVSRIDIATRFSPNLICPHPIYLSQTVLDKAEQIVNAFFQLRQSTEWSRFVLGHIRTEEKDVGHELRSASASVDPGNFSALMCFDFHLSEDGRLRLIETNTNASMGLVADLAYRTAGTPNPWNPSFRETILATFREEYRLSGLTRPLQDIVIVDENPEQQRLYLEFLLYQETFERAGLRCLIQDPSALVFDPATGRLRDLNGRNFDLVYNRHTDFYLETPETAPLRDSWLAKAACVSPNPRDYALLADKQRLIDLSLLVGGEGNGKALSDRFGLSPAQASALSDSLLRTLDVSRRDPAELWSERKKFFFKPKRSFGGKAVYKGASVSRTIFENQILKNDYIAQEFAAPPTIELPTNESGPGGTFKYDLRFVTYQDRIQIAVARCYQGQTTNFQNPGGGIAVIQSVTSS